MFLDADGARLNPDADRLIDRKTAHKASEISPEICSCLF